MPMIIFSIILKLSLGDITTSHRNMDVNSYYKDGLSMGPTSFLRITGDILCLCRLGDVAILFSCLEIANREFIKKKILRIKVTYFCQLFSYISVVFGVLYWISFSPV